MAENIIIIGRGDFAASFFDQLGPLSAGRYQAVPFSEDVAWRDVRACLHVGSGRQLAEVHGICWNNKLPLVQAATGIDISRFGAIEYPLLVAPNLCLGMVRFIKMLQSAVGLFAGAENSLAESHQASKTSVPGTAQAIAEAVGLPADAVTSVRDRVRQTNAWQIPDDYLDRHACHRLASVAGDFQVHLETRVYGRQPYVQGAVEIFDHIDDLPPGVTQITDFLTW